MREKETKLEKKQVRVSHKVSGMVDALEKKLVDSDIFINTRQDVVSRAIVDLYNKEFKL